MNRIYLVQYRGFDFSADLCFPTYGRASGELLLPLYILMRDIKNNIERNYE